MTRNTDELHPDRVYMTELEALLDRKRATIRMWEREGKLPRRLLPRRDEIDWRYWTWDQVIGIAEWIRDKEMFSGKTFGSEKRRRAQYKLNQKRVDKIKKLAARRQAAAA